MDMAQWYSPLFLNKEVGGGGGMFPVHMQDCHQARHSTALEKLPLLAVSEMNES